MLFPLTAFSCKCQSPVMPRVISYHALHSISSIAGRVNEAENVVKDVVVAAVRQELESLAVAHGSPLLLTAEASSHASVPLLPPRVSDSLLQAQCLPSVVLRRSRGPKLVQMAPLAWR